MTSSLGAARTTVLAVVASVSVVAGGAVVLSAPATAQSTLSPASQHTTIDTMEVIGEPTPSEPTPSAPSPSAPSPSAPSPSAPPSATATATVSPSAAPLATTTTLVVEPVSVPYGAAPAVTADVTQTGSSAKPGGSVAFTFDGLTVTAAVTAGQAKATLPKTQIMGVRPVTAVFTPASPAFATSTGTTNVTVVRDTSTSTAKAVYRDATDRVVGKSTVAAEQGTAVTGSVKFVLKRDGVKIRKALVDVNAFGKAKHVFRNIAKPGTYKLVAKYLGSATLARSTDKVTLVV